MLEAIYIKAAKTAEKQLPMGRLRVRCSNMCFKIMITD